MADEANTQVSEQDTSVEETTAESQSDNQTGEQTSQSAESTDSSKQEGNTEGKADQSASTGDKSKSGDQDSKPDSKPLSRRSAAYRISQLVEENKTLKQQLGKPKEQDDWETPQEDEPKADIQALIDAAVEKRLNPVISESSKAADDAEINELFSGDKASERTKYESPIRDMWKLPQYKDVAASELYKIASFNDAVASATAKAIEDYKKAEREAKESSGSGSANTSNRTGKGGKSVNDMTDEEFIQHNERIKAGQA